MMDRLHQIDGIKIRSKRRAQQDARDEANFRFVLPRQTFHGLLVALACEFQQSHEIIAFLRHSRVVPQKKRARRKLTFPGKFAETLEGDGEKFFSTAFSV